MFLNFNNIGGCIYGKFPGNQSKVLFAEFHFKKEFTYIEAMDENT